MDFWFFVLACVLISAVAKLLASAIDGQRDTRIAKVEADLKLKLIERLHDPELVRRVVEARLPLDKSLEAGAAVPEEPGRAGSQANRPATGSGGIFVLLGLTSFLVGIAFVIASLAVNNRELILPGAICTAVGLALLTFATSQKQIRKHLDLDSIPAQADSAHET